MYCPGSNIFYSRFKGSRYFIWHLKVRIWLESVEQLPFVWQFNFPIVCSLVIWLPTWILNGVYSLFSANFCSNTFEKFFIRINIVIKSMHYGQWIYFFIINLHKFNLEIIFWKNLKLLMDGLEYSFSNFQKNKWLPSIRKVLIEIWNR